MSSGEIDRIRHVYERYDEDAGRQARYDPGGSGNQAILTERWRVIADLLQRSGAIPLSGRRVLEVGCGRGDNVGPLLELGVEPALLTGVDLSFDRTTSAREAHRNIAFAVANGERLPFASETFDAVVLFTVISSILDERVAQALALESARVLRTGGVVVWYDLRMRNPRNRHVRGVGRRELERLFPGLHQWRRSVTVAPPLARSLGPAARWLYPVLGSLPPLRSHYAAVLRKGDRSRSR